MRKMLKGRRPSPALIVAVVALTLALAGTAVAGIATISVLTKQEKKQVKKISKKQAKKLIAKLQIPTKGVGSGDFFLSSVTNGNFGQVNASDCSGSPGQSPSLSVSAPGISETDHVLATPPPGWAQTFVLSAIPNPASQSVTLAACNNFFAGSGDPDGNGGQYKVLVIR